MAFFRHNKSSGAFRKTGAQKKENGVRLSPQQQTTLIGKANKLLNGGNIDQAYKVFATLKYYDGLMRVSKAYYNNGQCTEAYLAACKAGAHRDVESLGKAIAGALRVWLQPEGKSKEPVMVMNNNNIQPPDPNNIKKLLAIAKARKDINY